MRTGGRPEATMSWLLAAALLAGAAPPDLATVARLDDGPFAVGVRAIRVRDAARPWPSAEDPAGALGRPIQVTVWYPASRVDTPPLVVEDYVLLDWTGASPARASEAQRAGALAAARRAFGEGLDAPLGEEAWARASGARGRARLEAPPLPGRRALVVFETGLNGRSYLYLPLVERLASEGYVVASLASFGKSETERLGFDLDGVRAQVADQKRALELLGERPEVDASRVALVAWSAGGVSQALLRLETPEAFRAAVSLDSGTGYAYGAGLLREAGGVDVSRLTVPFLQMDAGVASPQVPLDDSFYRAHGRAPSERVVLDGLRHGDLVLPYGAGRAIALGDPGPDLRRLSSVLLAFLDRYVPAGYATETVAIDSHGWRLAGDLARPDGEGQAPAVLLLNGAAGDRRVYAALAESLARRGVASLRLDLRGHGESTNLGRFAPGPEGLALIERTHEDVAAARAWLAARAGIDASRIGVVGASYSGEAMMKGLPAGGRAAAYVALSPGSLSDESIAAIDGEALPFLLVASRHERHLKEVVQALREQSRTAELLELGGTAHATRLFGAHGDLAERIATWFSGRLASGALARP
jgi:dienelactone hydrolase